MATFNLEGTKNKHRNVMNITQILLDSRRDSMLMLIPLLKWQKYRNVDYVLGVSGILTASIFNMGNRKHIVPEQECHRWQQENASDLLGTFAKSRKITICFVTSDFPSVCLHGTTWLPMDGSL
jgi:hypothetical protein